jgi:hypothetical protein
VAGWGVIGICVDDVDVAGVGLVGVGVATVDTKVTVVSGQNYNYSRGLATRL